MSSFVILAVAALFLALILQLAAKPKALAAINAMVLPFVAVSGILIYGYGFSWAVKNPLLAIVRGTLAVCGMFVGKNDFSIISGAPLFESEGAVIFFWLIHMGALYLTASAAITTVGVEALKALRLWLARTGQLILIFGTDDDSIAYGKIRIAERGNSVLYVASDLTADQAAAISKMGASVRTDAKAVTPDMSFLKKAGIRTGKRQIEVYAVSADERANLNFALELMAQMKEREVDPAQTSISIIGPEYIMADQLQGTDEKYGYGHVNVFRKPELSARQMIKKCPPCDYITFDDDGRAVEDFECVVLGFGRQGQAALKYLIMNGQFEGSHFHAAVFDPIADKAAGLMGFDAPEMLRQYDVDFYECDARSKQFYTYLQENMKKIKYIVICTSPEKLNAEIAEELVDFDYHSDLHAAIVQCYHYGVVIHQDGKSVSYPSYTRDNLDAMETDKLAMLLNHHYSSNPDHTPWQDWVTCNFFNRMSSRASADFFPAYLRSAGKTEEEALENWNLTEKQLENMGRTEHLRWNSFHFVMGYSLMSDEEWNARAEAYKKEMKEKGSSKIRISKNAEGKKHACLVTWEGLKDLDRKESAVTGRKCDYQQPDKDNVLMVPVLLKALKENE